MVALKGRLRQHVQLHVDKVFRRQLLVTAVQFQVLNVIQSLQESTVIQMESLSLLTSLRVVLKLQLCQAHAQLPVPFHQQAYQCYKQLFVIAVLKLVKNAIQFTVESTVMALEI